mmetsp:Transcript_19553/g.35465  ORF Transcript_19553/g.35465 Transcript_19553/m.35465 type:complete len:252 (-) Transcript_19553:959-1714(-)
MSASRRRVSSTTSFFAFAFSNTASFAVDCASCCASILGILVLTMSAFRRLVSSRTCSLFLVNPSSFNSAWAITADGTIFSDAQLAPVQLIWFCTGILSSHVLTLLTNLGEGRVVSFGGSDWCESMTGGRSAASREAASRAAAVAVTWAHDAAFWDAACCAADDAAVSHASWSAIVVASASASSKAFVVAARIDISWCDAVGTTHISSCGTEKETSLHNDFWTSLKAVVIVASCSLVSCSSFGLVIGKCCCA